MKIFKKKIDIRFLITINPLAFLKRWARSSEGEHCFDVAGVSGSIPLGPTIFFIKGSRCLR